ncbi:MAG: efflux RND transporter periplasmic adaptor subunit [Pseudomonadota bacterium]
MSPCPSHRSRFPHLTIALLWLLVLGGCEQGDRSRSAAGGYQRPPTAVIASAVVQRPVSDVLEAIGTTQANESVTLSAKVTDTVSRVRFEDGQFVEQGAVLVELANAEESALLAEAEANVDESARQLRRLEDLYRKRAIPVSQRDEASAAYNAAKARYESLVARLDDLLIRAPFSGLLGFRDVSAGTLITPGTAITTLDDVSQIKLDFAVPEVHLAVLQPGLSLIARSTAYPDRGFPASVQTVATRIDPVTRTARVRAVVENKDRVLRPGMLLTVALQTNERIALAIPESALVQRSGRTSVYVVVQQEDGPALAAALRMIETGARYDGWVEVLRGLTEGERVITEGTLKVRDQSPIRLLEGRETAQEAAGGPRRPRRSA